MTLTLMLDGVISVPYDKITGLTKSPEGGWWPVTPIEGGGVAAVLSVHYQTNCIVRYPILTTALN